MIIPQTYSRSTLVLVGVASVLAGAAGIRSHEGLCLLLAGLCFLAIRLRIGATATALIVIGISINSLVEYASQAPLDMAPNSALAFAFIGLALLLSQTKWRVEVSQYVGLAGAFLGMLGVTGHVFAVALLIRVGTPAAMSTGVALMCAILGLAVLLIQPDRGLTRVLAGSNAGSVAARRFLPTVMGLPFILALLLRSLQLARPGAHVNLNPNLGSIVFLMVMSLVFAAPVIWTVVLFNRIEKKRAAAESRIQMLAHAMQSVSESISITDTNDKILFVNDAFIRTYGYSEAELVGQSITMVRSPNDPVSLTDEIHPTTLAGGWKGEILNRRRDGTDFPIALSTSVIRDDQNEPFALIGIAVDITARKLAEKQLVEAREAAESAALAKAQFLASMSHEIRTPMNGVIGMTELLLNTELTASQVEYVRTIHVSGENLLTIINDILDFSKIESGKIELEDRPFEIRDAIEEVLELLAPRAIEKGLDLVYLVEPHVPPFIMGDVTRFKQILINLVGNGIKFTHAGEVYVYATAWRQNDGSLELVCWVKDTGVGIAPDKLDRLFKAFSQVDASTNRRYGGTGLGLAISKRLAELMHGRIWAESELGAGAKFSFTMRTRRVEFIGLSPRAVAEEPDLEGKSVLLVDDNETNLRVLSTLLGEWKLKVRSASTPSAALEFIRQSQPFDLAILDMQMPEMNGIELGAAIRKLRSREELPMILLHSNAPSFKELSQNETVFGAVASKPVRRSQLLELVSSSLSQARTTIRPRRSVHRLDPDLARRIPLKILVAEDNKVNRELFITILNRMGYTADHAENGLEVLGALERSEYDVIFMDVHMPEMDGLEATRRIRALNNQLARRPRIVAMTAAALIEDRQKCLEAGMDDYLSKPIRLAEIEEAIERCGLAKASTD